MKVIHEQSLANTLAALSKKARARIWVASPYIGSLDAISRILNNPWNKRLLNLRLLTDLEECGKDAHPALNEFFRSGKIRSLRGLHAKIYILDDEVIVTSANLTATAFTKRYEMGVLLSAPESADAVAAFDSWWHDKTITTPVRQSDIAAIANRQGGRSDTGTGAGLKPRWSLPKLPQSASTSTGTSNTTDFNGFLASYEELANAYKARSGSKHTRFLNFEVDTLLDYLFHVGACPSKEYEKRDGVTPSPRRVGNLDKEIDQHLEGFNDWLKEDRGMSWRQERHRIITTILSKPKIKALTYASLRDVADCLNCMNSYAINKARFCNPDNNPMLTIIESLTDLVHGEGDTVDRIRSSVSRLKYFGLSSAQELLGFYYPDVYPLRNGNSNAGLRYFGFNVGG